LRILPIWKAKGGAQMQIFRVDVVTQKNSYSQQLDQAQLVE